MAPSIYTYQETFTQILEEVVVMFKRRTDRWIKLFVNELTYSIVLKKKDIHQHLRKSVREGSIKFEISCDYDIWISPLWVAAL